MEMIEVTIDWNDEDSDSGIMLTPLGENRYRLEESIVGQCVDSRREERRRRPRVKDVFEAQLLEPGRLRFIGVVERARMKAKSWIIGQREIDSPHLERALQKVLDLGGA